MQGFVFTDPLSISVAIFVAILVGLSKGGLGGAMAILGVAILSLVIPPVQAAGILLPILLVMDFIGCWVWRKHWDLAMVWALLPAGIVGVVVGWALATVVSDAVVRLIVGSIAVVYLFTYLRGLIGATPPPRQPNRLRGSFWSFLAGYTSFVAHAGGPAYQIYTMPLRVAPTVYTATSTLFFTLVNLAKMPPYAALGQLGPDNLVTSAVLMPVAAVATVSGAWLVRRIPMHVFYPFMHLMLALVAAKLLWDGWHGL